jgi:hypothetical protein
VICKYQPDSNWLLVVPTWLLAVMAIISAGATIKAIREQMKSSKLTISADLAMKFDKTFSESSFLADRARAAEALKSSNPKEAENVFDFFDMVGLFVRLKALDLEIAHSLFFHWINLYWTTGKEYIGSKQQTDSTKWLDFKLLYEGTRQIESRDEHSENLILTRERIAEYLKDEIALIPNMQVAKPDSQPS